MSAPEKEPLISVVIPIYNKEKEVLRAVNSVLSQAIKDFEIIVVNDGSTDSGPDIVKALKDPRIKIINQENAGVSAARNRGIAEAQTDFIAFLDADDEWLPDFLETIIYLRNKFPSSDVFATNYLFKRSNNVTAKTVLKGLPVGFKEGILKDYFQIASKSDPPVWSSAVAVRKVALQSVGGFPVNVRSGEDLLTWARLAAKYDIAYTREPKAYFHQSETLPEYPRRPQTPDFVGEQLAVLLSKIKTFQVSSLKEYIALWHRMRANVFIRLQQPKEARKEILKAFTYSRISKKLYFLAFLTFIPSNAAIKILRFLKTRKEVQSS